MLQESEDRSENSDSTTTLETATSTLSSRDTADMSLFMAAKALVCFSLPLLLRSGILATDDAVKVILISKKNESWLAAYSDIQAVLGLISSILVGSAWSISPIVSFAKKTHDTQTGFQLRSSDLTDHQNKEMILSLSANTYCVESGLDGSLNYTVDYCSKQMTLEQFSISLSASELTQLKDIADTIVRHSLEKIYDDMIISGNVFLRIMKKEYALLWHNQAGRLVESPLKPSESEKVSLAIYQNFDTPETVTDIKLIATIQALLESKNMKRHEPYNIMAIRIKTREELKHVMLHEHLEDRLLERDGYSCNQKIGVLFREAMLYGLLMSIPSALLAANGRFLLSLFKQPSVVLDNSNTYFWVTALGLSFETLYRAQLRFMVGLGIRKTALYGELLDVGVDLTLTYAFLFERFGLRDVGLSGAAIAYSTAKAITLIAHTLYLFHNRSLKPYRLFQFCRPIQTNILITLAKKGLPIGFDGCASFITSMLITFFCGLDGKKGLVAIQAASLYSSIVSIPLGAIGQASSVLVGEHADNKKSHDALTYGNATFLICTGYAGIMLLAAMLLPHFIARIIIDPTDQNKTSDFDMAVKFIRIQGLLDLFNGMRWGITTPLGGLLDTFIPMLITIFCELFLNIGLGAIAKFALKKEENIIYGSQLIGYAIATAILMARWVQKSREFKLSSVDKPSEDINPPCRVTIRSIATQTNSPSYSLRDSFWKLMGRNTENNNPETKRLLFPSQSV